MGGTWKALSKRLILDLAKVIDHSCFQTSTLKVRWGAREASLSSGSWELGHHDSTPQSWLPDEPMSTHFLGNLGPRSATPGSPGKVAWPLTAAGGCPMWPGSEQGVQSRGHLCRHHRQIHFMAAQRGPE